MNEHDPGSRWWLLQVFALACLLAAAAPFAVAQMAPDAPAAKVGSGVGKALRYVSLKADRVLLHQGPGADYPTAWVFKRTGLPVAVIEESEVWRKVRDAGGTEGWVHMSLLSSRRTALILPWEVKEGQKQAASATLRDSDRESARAVAHVEAGVLAGIIACENGWCRVSVGDYRGYIEQDKLWGTYPNEEIKQ